MNWIKHDGQQRPISSTSIIDITYRNREVFKNTKAGHHRWIHARYTTGRCFKEYDIMKYKLTSD